MNSILSFLMLILFFKLSHAEKLDLATHDSLIQKLESVSGLDSTDTMILQLNLANRLADLYADRARLLSIDIEGKGDKIHQKQISSDRKKSISILNKILNSLDSTKQGPALLQMAHLHNLLGEQQQTLNILNKIEKNSNQYDNKTVSLVIIQLGDIAFASGDYELAQKYFFKAISLKENPRLGYSLFRVAWIHYNLGQTIKAEKELIALLRNSELFINAQKNVDISFQEEVSHDLATFIAKNDITTETVSTLALLSPETAKKNNLIYLAKELDRTAKKNSALKVWKIVGTQNITLEECIEKQIQIVRIQYDLGHYNSLLLEMDKAIELLKKTGCKQNAECTVGQQDLRRVITDWVKSEERLPTSDLILAFKKYTNSFDDSEMNYWAAQAAYKRKQYKDSFSFYEKTVNLLLNNPNKNLAQHKMFDGSLLGMIEVAELSNDSQLRLKSYQKYIELNPKGDKASEVRYQVAHWYYEVNNYAEARTQFISLALDKKMPNDLKEKSADLCLDSDVLLKNEAQIEQDSYKLALNLPNKKQEYLQIYRKSILNQTAHVLNSTIQKNQVTYEQELMKLDSLNLILFSGEQLQQMFKNKITLAFRLKNLEALSQNCMSLLLIKNLSQEDRNLALQHLSWIAEVKLNFKTALKYFSKIEPNSNKSKSLGDYYFKKAFLKELAQENPTYEYEKYIISHGSALSQKQYAAHQIIQFSNKPSLQFKKYEHILLKNEDLYNSAALDVFEKTKDLSFAKKVLRRKSFKNSVSGNLVSHALAISELQAIEKSLRHEKLAGLSDASISKSILKRQKIIKQLEAIANQAIQRKDTTLQIIYLTKMTEAQNNLAQEILRLPLPKKLKSYERKQYQDQVQILVAPFILQAKNIQNKIIEIWNDANKYESFKPLSDLALQNTEMKSGSQLAAVEIKLLIASAQSINAPVDAIEKYSEARHKTLSDVLTVQEKIKRNPFNMSDLTKLKELQVSLGSGPMVAYLDSRLAEGQTH